MNDEFQGSWSEHGGAHGDQAQHGAMPSTPPAAPLKQIVTIRLDVDTLTWFKAAGPGYQTRINQLLREHMEAQLAQARAVA